MTVSMFQLSVPAFVRMLNQLDAMLDKAAAHAAAKKIDPLVLTGARLAPDMFPLSRQIMIACDFCKGAVSRLAGKDVPSWPDTDTTFPELKARIAKTLEHVKSFEAGGIDGSETRQIKIKAGTREMEFQGRDYLTYFVLPNLYFHSTAAYAILRHNGLELGKSDFMGSL